MFTINPRNKEPIYAQLVSQLRYFIAIDAISPNESLPSVRQLSVTLGINPNTVQKAYRQMEQEGLIYAIGGSGYFVTDDIDTQRQKQQEEMIDTLEKSLQKMKESGVDQATIQRIVQSVYQEGKTC